MNKTWRFWPTISLPDVGLDWREKQSTLNHKALQTQAINSKPHKPKETQCCLMLYKMYNVSVLWSQIWTSNTLRAEPGLSAARLRNTHQFTSADTVTIEPASELRFMGLLKAFYVIYCKSKIALCFQATLAETESQFAYFWKVRTAGKFIVLRVK